MKDISRWIKDMTVSIRELFLKGPVGRYLRDCLTFACLAIKRPVPRIEFIEDPTAPPAYTDGRKFVINYASRFITDQETREEKLLIAKGLAVHEYCHYRFTDFLLLRKVLNHAREKKTLYPPVPYAIEKTAQYADLTEALPLLSGEHLAYFLRDIHNILEDGYGEEGGFRVLSGGLSDALWCLRDYQWSMTMPLDELLALLRTEKIGKYDVITSLLLQYSKYGKFLYDQDAETERDAVNELREVIPYVDEILYADIPYERGSLCNAVFVLLWDYIKPLIRRMADEGISSFSFAGRDGLASEMPEGTTSSVMITSDEDHGISGSLRERRKTRETVGTPSPEDGEESEADAKSAGAPDDGDVETSRPADESTSGTEGPGTPEGSPATDGDRGEDRSEEGLMEEEDGDTDMEDFLPDRDKVIADLDRDIRGIEREGLEEKALDAMEKERSEELSKALAELPLTPLHRKYKRQLIRNIHLSSDIAEEAQPYLTKCQDVADVLARKLEPLLKKKGDDLPFNGCFSGSRFDITRLVYNDFRYFRQNTCPNPNSGTAVTILVDESGSMATYDRISMARAASMVLYLFCQRLHIPCAVYGHTAEFSSGSLVMSLYADFEGSDRDKYRLLGISAKEDNRDGAAISFAGEQLLQRSEPTKLLVIICDGAPCAKGYHGPAAEADMTAIVRELRRRDVAIFAAAIGSDKENISRIFEEGFLDITDLDSLPNQLVELVRRYIRL